ncbi:MAG TPA: UDP-2,3-diacylglucosamine diphosphatase [Candidatus Eisenbacteria bacterium]|nr:UDP-2,3-diacylglucosamine diphosphatase [Candidatus Eisenbacteria bacterium]
MPTERPAFFIADAHLGQGSPESNRDRERDLLAFFDHVGATGASLFVNGDLFDFWFEYGHAIPKRFVRVLLALESLKRHGVPVTYVGGNHDFWIGDYLRREIGISFHDEPIPLSIQGRKILLAHGDGLGPGDAGYKLLKGVLRARLSRFLFRWIHPDVGIPIASGTSHTSRRHAPRRARSDEELETTLGGPFFEAGHDAVILGHYHRPLHRSAPGRDFIILGDWIHGRSVVRLEEGRFTLLERAPGI